MDYLENKLRQLKEEKEKAEKMLKENNSQAGYFAVKIGLLEREIKKIEDIIGAES